MIHEYPKGVRQYSKGDLVLLFDAKILAVIISNGMVMILLVVFLVGTFMYLLGIGMNAVCTVFAFTD